MEDFMNAFFPTNTDHQLNLPFYLTSSGIFFTETEMDRPHGYTSPQWIQTISGSGQLYINDEVYDIFPNTGLFIPAHLPHHYMKTGEDWITHWVSFDGYAVADLLQAFGLTDFAYMPLNDPHQTQQLLEQIYRLSNNEYHQHYFKISTLLYDTIYEIHRLQSTKKNTDIHGSQMFLTLLTYIENHYMDDFSLNDLASIIQRSPQYVCRLFQTELSMRPFEYVRNYRLSKSKSLLLSSPDLSIQDVALRVGIKSPSYYSALFKKEEKITPREFIQLHQRGV